MEIGIIGAGITGLSLGQLLNDKHKITLYDSKQKGGLIRCKYTLGHLYHIVGGHVFNSKNQNVLDWFWSFFDKDKEFLQARRNAQIWMDDRYIGYPIENHLHQLLPNTAKKIISELLELNKQGRSFSSFDELVSRYADFGDFFLSNFGRQLFELYFQPYNEKIWKRSPFSIPLAWLEGKLPMINVKEVITNNIIRQEEDRMVHSTFYYPRQDGSQFIVDRLSQNLDIKEERPISSIRYEKGKLTVNGTFSKERIIYTGDIRKLLDIFDGEELCNIIAPFKAKISELQSNGTTNILCETNTTSISWLYLPDKELLPHRIIYTGNFSDNNYPTQSRKSCTVEFSGFLNKAKAYTEIEKLPGNLLPIDYHFQESSYVVQNQDTRDIIRAIKSSLEPYGIYLLGRFAEWEYYNMDKCIEAAMLLAKKL